MKREGLSLAIFTIVSILGFIALLLLNKYHQVYAFELEKIGEINEQIENGYFSQLEEDSENNNPVLSDTIEPIQEVEYEAEDNYNDSEGDSDMQNDSEVLEDSEVVEDDITSEEKFQIMIIFCFGLVAGVVVGHFLTGFIK